MFEPMEDLVGCALTVAIPTYRRGEVLLETIGYLLDLATASVEILVLDQTSDHPTGIKAALERLGEQGRITWVRLPVPSIPRAMNQGLLRARGEVVLFVDDDIRPDASLLSAHLHAQELKPGWIVAGRVLQPWHRGAWDPADNGRFAFNTPGSREVTEFMGGNFSVNRRAALALGGFDENFVRVAYRFEAEFALRWRRSGRAIWYEQDALIHHLKATDGGTRVFGDYLRTALPAHSVGEYYFAFHARPPRWWRTVLVRPFRSVVTRHHLRRPWWIPVTLCAEFAGIAWALVLALRGARLVHAPVSKLPGAA